jgi:hypothetical protein
MTHNDFDRTARLWLEDGPTEMSDRALAAALDEIHVTRQRHAWWPARRVPSMGNTFRLGAGLAAVLLAAVVGISLLQGGGPGAAPPAPSPTPTPTPVAIPTGTAPALMSPGTYVTGDPFLVRSTLDLPDGWEGNVGGPYAVFLDQIGGTASVGLTLSQIIYADPCHYDKGLLKPVPGPSVDDLANALVSLPGIQASKPTDVTVGGYHAKQLTLTAPTSIAGCNFPPGETFRVWQLPLGATNDLAPGASDELWILDVNGQRLVIDSYEPPGQGAQVKAEVQAILESIRFATTDGPSPSP